MNKLTQSEVITRFRKVHGDRYDYAEFVYVNTSTKSTITCHVHGDFEQLPGSHSKGNGCPECNKGGNQFHAITAVLKQFKTVHGDRYDYSKFVYIGSHTKGTITCSNHGDFRQSSNVHGKGHGCPICAGQYSPSTSEVVNRFKTVHGDRYIYDNVDYVGTNTKVEIICRQHGPFMQTPSKHLMGKGCNECGLLSASRKYKIFARKRRDDLLLSDSIAPEGWAKKTRSRTDASLASGEIVRQHRCQICGIGSDEVRIEGHHIHYDRPDSWKALEWLCTDCHVTYGHDGYFANPPISVVLDPVDNSVYNPALCPPIQDHGLRPNGIE